MNKESKAAILVGITTVFSLVLFTVVISILEKWNFGQEGFAVNVQYNFLNDIVPGAPVKLAGGVEIGYIKNIEQEGVVTFR